MTAGQPIVIVRQGAFITRGAVQEITPEHLYLAVQGEPVKIARATITDLTVTSDTDGRNG